MARGKAARCAQSGELGVSRPGTLAAATVTPSSGEPFIAISVYAAWERPHSLTMSDWIYADASVHRLISDLSVFIGKQSGHNILVAGDLNILFGYGEGGSAYWASRYDTVFSRMATLGLSFMGPQAPAGRRAEPWPDELPSASNNVPTFHHSRRHRRRVPVNWISCLPLGPCPNACASGHSTSLISGAQAIIAASRFRSHDPPN